MPLFLPNSTFFHVGRTGGHWVSNVLHHSGLVRSQITPLHLTPVQARTKIGYIEKPFSFCFIRHPLKWLASLWCHETEFGWLYSGFSASTENDTFTDFLERALSLAPDQPCSSHFAPFLDFCEFIGRTEFLSADLRMALDRANEQFDPSCLTAKPLNETSIKRIQKAARAPRRLLEKIMSREQDFIRRFDYPDVPDELVDEGASRSLWPCLSLKDGADVGALKAEQQLGLTRLTFDYRFESGERLRAEAYERRTQWALIDALQNTPRQSSCVIVAESDPYFAFLAAELGWDDVTFVCSSRRCVSERLLGIMEKTVKVVEYSQFFNGQGASPSGYDMVCLVDTLEMTPFIELELIAASAMLRPQGTLIFSMSVIDAPDNLSFKTLWPFGTEMISGRKVSYSTITYAQNFLRFLGLDKFSICDVFNEAANDKLKPAVQTFAQHVAVDPNRLLRKAIISAAREADECSQRHPAHCDEIVKNWQSRQPGDLTVVPLDGLSASYRVTIATLQADLKAERNRREEAEQGLAERDHELVKVRSELAATGIDADYHRSELLRARSIGDDWATRYSQLMSRIEFVAK